MSPIVNTSGPSWFPCSTVEGMFAHGLKGAASTSGYSSIEKPAKVSKKKNGPLRPLDKMPKSAAAPDASAPAGAAEATDAGAGEAELSDQGSDDDESQ